MFEASVLAAVLHLSAPQKVAAEAAVIPHSISAFASCVSKRESHHNYRARNPHSSAQGRWQLLDRAWRSSAAWMVRDRLIKFGMPKPEANRVRNMLTRTPIAKWRPVYQDAAFVAIVTAKRDGWRHWYLNGSRCNALAA